MSGNNFGQLFKITTFGESHGEALGVVIDGMPSKIEISIPGLMLDLKKRAPGKEKGMTSRIEGDEPIILSGIFEGKTTGAPIAVIVKNTNQKSEDYEKLKNEYRPGHADRTYEMKYGIRDYRGGGRSSGRETVSRVIAGYFASLIIPKIKVRGFVTRIGSVTSDEIPNDLDTDFGRYQFYGVSDDVVEDYLVNLKKEGDSVGGQLKIIIDHCPPGLGEPVFDKLKADFGKALLSIGGCVSFSYGIGDDLSRMRGSEVAKNVSAFSGIEGGISNGDRMILTASFKPTSTIGEKALSGRHDPCIVPRAVAVAEAMVKIVLADHYLRQNSYIKK